MIGQDIKGAFIVEPDGCIALGPSYGRVDINNLRIPQAEQAILGRLRGVLRNPEVGVTKIGHLTTWRSAKIPGAPTVEMPGKLPYRIGTGHQLKINAVGTLLGQDIRGTYVVEKEGTVPLGPSYGRVKVDGFTLREAEEEIVKHLKKILQHPEVSVTLGGWEIDDSDDRIQGLEAEVRRLKLELDRVKAIATEKGKSGD